MERLNGIPMEIFCLATIYRLIHTIVKIFCIGDRSDHYQRNPDVGMVDTKVKSSSLMKVSNDGCDWSISFVFGKSGTRLQLP